MTNPLIRYILFLSRRASTGSVICEAIQSLVQSLIWKKWLLGREVVTFFQPNFTGIILRAIWVDLATQNWSRGDLKKWHFVWWNPYCNKRTHIASYSSTSTMPTSGWCIRKPKFLSGLRKKLTSWQTSQIGTGCPKLNATSSSMSSLSRRPNVTSFH